MEFQFESLTKLVGKLHSLNPPSKQDNEDDELVLLYSINTSEEPWVHTVTLWVHYGNNFPVIETANSCIGGEMQ